MNDYRYKVYDRDGKPKLSATLSCRYDKETERNLLDSGYTIKINGRKLTRKELKV